jgi:hypothetical protein
MKSRRDALRTLAASAIVPALRAQHQHTDVLVEAAKPAGPKNTAAPDFELLKVLVDFIIPRTDTPGALDAGVHFYIDRALGNKPSVASQLAPGLRRLRDAGFLRQTAEQQIQQLKAMEADKDPFFSVLKDLTIDGYYSSKEGLVSELGYHGNTYVREFKGCTHPEHGATSDAN